MNKSMKETETICLYLISPDYVGDISMQETTYKVYFGKWELCIPHSHPDSADKIL